MAKSALTIGRRVEKLPILEIAGQTWFVFDWGLANARHVVCFFDNEEELDVVLVRDAQDQTPPPAMPAAPAPLLELIHGGPPFPEMENPPAG